MRVETRTVKIGEWIGDVPDDWDFSKFYRENIGQDESTHNKAASLFVELQKAVKEGKSVYATQSGGFSHKVIHCGLYDGWPFWKPRPCYSYEGPIPGEHIDEYYNLRGIRIEARKAE